MNTDFRIAVGMTSHPKTVKLMRRCGDRAFFCLVHLWEWAAQFRPEGDLFGMDDEAIEIASGWTGEDGVFVAQLSAVGFIDGESGSYVLHDWRQHNDWASEAEVRSGESRLSKLAQVNREAFEYLQEREITSVSKEEYLKSKSGDFSWMLATASDRRAIASDRRATAERPLALTTGPAPAPAPAPSPSPALQHIPPSLRSGGCPEVPAGPSEPEPPPPIPDSPVIMAIPLTVKGTEFEIRQADIDQWQETFPSVDVLAELRKCRQWSVDHPKRRKTAAGIRGHISAWLGKCQDQARAPRPREPDRQQRPKATTVAQDLAQQRDAAALRLKEKYGIGGPRGDEHGAIPGGGAGHAGRLEPGAQGGPALPGIA